MVRHILVIDLAIDTPSTLGRTPAQGLGLDSNTFLFSGDTRQAWNAI